MKNKNGFIVFNTVAFFGAIVLLAIVLTAFLGKTAKMLIYNQELLVEINAKTKEIDKNIYKQTLELNIEINKLKHEVAMVYSKLIDTEIAINEVDKVNLSQEKDIIILTEAIMSFKDIWETLELQKFTATAYSPFDNVSGIENDGDPTNTATGTYPDWGTFAVDPRVIPYHSKIIVIGDNFIEHGVALDTGATMRKFGTWIDLYRDTYQQTLEFGKQEVFVIWKESKAE